LNHEILNNSVKNYTVVEAFSREEYEVINRVRCLVGEELKDDIAASGLYRRCIGFLWIDAHRWWG
jgi:hypothetical protein